jgi:superfamily II DNA/RNA helicase
MLLKLIMIGEGVPDTELVLGASEIACVRAPPILKIAATPQPNAPKLDLDNVNKACSSEISAQGGVMPFTKLPPLLAEALAARDYVTPTPVQAAVLETEAEGRDLIVSAQTGSGKTVAFGLAMAPLLLNEEGRASQTRTPLALAIAPTRELALQVSRELMWLYGKAGARIATCVGGMDASKERRALSQGAHIVVGTPGRLRDHLERGALNLTGLCAVVLDEADTPAQSAGFGQFQFRKKLERAMRFELTTSTLANSK